MSGPSRVPDLHKSAFWIYGVTAMVMREPLSILLHHAADAGWGDAGVHREALRALIVWMLLSRQFTVTGVYFDRVYLQPDSAARYTEPYLHAWGISYYLVEYDADGPRISAAFQEARATNRPVAVLVGDEYHGFNRPVEPPRAQR